MAADSSPTPTAATPATEPDNGEPAEGSPPTREQALALGDLMRRFSASRVDVNCHPFDLPKGWLYVVLKLPSGPDFHAGVDPEGNVSS